MRQLLSEGISSSTDHLCTPLLSPSCPCPPQSTSPPAYLSERGICDLLPHMGLHWNPRQWHCGRHHTQDIILCTQGSILLPPSHSTSAIASPSSHFMLAHRSRRPWLHDPVSRAHYKCSRWSTVLCQIWAWCLGNLAKTCGNHKTCTIQCVLAEVRLHHMHWGYNLKHTDLTVRPTVFHKGRKRSLELTQNVQSVTAK